MKVKVTSNKIPAKVGDLVTDSIGSIGIMINEDTVLVLSDVIMRSSNPRIVPKQGPVHDWSRFDGTVTLSND